LIRYGCDRVHLLDLFRAVRARTTALAEPLSADDQMVQSMPDASPTKWHLAHTSWFFETFVLSPAGGAVFDPAFRTLFNSYYEAVGVEFDRARRGTLSRPTLAEVHRYRRHVDDGVGRLLESGQAGEAMRPVIELGIHHEQQHQELLLTDIKHAFGTSPLRPIYRAAAAAAGSTELSPAGFKRFNEGLALIGNDGAGFSFDNEGPRHRRFLGAYAICERPVTCGEYLAFMRDGGYERAELWLSDGWQLCQRERWQAPLYWERRDHLWLTYTLGGVRSIDEGAAVAHVSYFEADAYARWAGARLPTEEEWEHAAAGTPIEGHFADTNRFEPGPVRNGLYGDVWQWTASPYAPYPGFRAAPGAIGEYNGKFMCNQMVLRGGSCLTPADHVRATYRNFFPPAARWQMSGIRLARDA
jgi:ergothioneine biosynthesis protein EgtB